MRYFFIICLACMSFAETLYVDTNGNDTSGDGSSTFPWATITHALDNAEDGDLILVRPGTYNGRIRLRGVFNIGVTVRSEIPYRAHLRHDGTVITCYYGIGITVEGFDISHSSPGSEALVIQIQDLRGTGPGGTDATSFITFRDNIIHDSYNNDLLKINYGARDILVEGNLFFNQAGSDEHIDINGVVRVEVRKNIFFNSFESSGRTNGNNTSSYIVIKNSGSLPLSGDSYIHKNIFLNWQGSSGNNFILIGEDGKPHFEAENILIENNLLIGNSPNNMRAAFGVKGGKDITFRNNTITGDLPSLAFAMRLNTEGSNPPNENITFYNNIWSDPTGSMGATFGSTSNDFSDTPIGETLSFELDNNLFWNNGAGIPSSSSELVNYTDDSNRIIDNPELASTTSLVLPYWNSATEQFNSGSLRVFEEFLRLVESYATMPETAPTVDTARVDQSPVTDILGTPRSSPPDIGAFEYSPCQSVFNLDQNPDIDILDLYVILEFWRTENHPGFDTNPIVDIIDFIQLINAFAPCTP